jgi:glycerol-3-phosphate dehydrogenase (NAD(P)+)
MPMDTISIVGGGGWGTALAVMIAKNGHTVRLWVRRKELAEALDRERINQQYLPGIALPKSILVTNELSEAAKADILFFVTPSTALREVATSLAATSSLRRNTIVLSAVKGIELGTGSRMSEILGSTFPGHPIAVLSGPNHAVEVANFTPTATVIGALQEEIGKKLQRVISTKSFRAYTSPDIVGIEVGGALKNVFAIAAGIADGLGLGDNSKAALVTRSLAEMARLGSALGGKRETFQGLSGAGDLIVTCFSRHSRNRRVGERIGRGEHLIKIQSSMRMVAEGVPTARSAKDCAIRLAVTTPIINEVNSILYENSLPDTAMERLISRAFRPEED